MLPLIEMQSVAPIPQKAWALKSLCLWLIIIGVSGFFAACGGGSDGPVRPSETEGVLDIVLTGLPAGTAVEIDVTGPNGFAETLRAAGQIGGLAPGTYSILAEDVHAAGDFFEAVDPNPTSVTIRAGQTTQATVAFEKLEGFKLKVTPAQWSLSYDEVRTFEVTVVRASDFTGEILVGLQGLPPGVAADELPIVVAKNATSFTLELTNEGTAVGEHALSFAAASYDNPTIVSLGVPLTVGPIVTRSSDVEPPVPGELRYVAAHPSVVGQTIVFDEAVFPAGERTVIEMNGSMKLNIEVAIVAPTYEGDHPRVAITRTGGSGPLFSAGALGIVTVRNLELSGSKAMAIRNNGTLTIERSVLRDNFHAIVGPGGGGAALTSGGILVVADSVVRGNSSQRPGGAVYITDGSASFVGTVFGDNIAPYEAGATQSGRGGAIFVAKGDVEIDDCLFERNISDRDGGAIFFDGGGQLTITNSQFQGNESGNGGAVFTGSSSKLAITESRFMENTASQGGALVSFSLGATIVGSTFLNNEAWVNGGAIRAHKSMDIEDTIVRGNRAGRQGGILNAGAEMMVRGCTIVDNHATNGDGGGLFNYENARVLTIVESTIADNTATGDGGGIFNDAGARVVVNASTLHGNTAQNGGGLAVVDAGASFLLLNSTVTDNTAQNGGGVYVAGTGGTSSSISFATIVRNRGTVSGGGVYSSANLLMRATIVALNEAPLNPDIAGSGNSVGYNLIETGNLAWSNHATDIYGVDPDLGELTDNGGPTHTIAFEKDAPPYDRIPSDKCTMAHSADAGADVLDDQRGERRPNDNACDIGAFEGGFLM